VTPAGCDRSAALVDSLRRHEPADDEEARDRDRILAFVLRHEHPFDRGILEGHLTGSAITVSADGSRVLLLHHRKLDRWLQPGGHGDPGETTGEEVALREAFEESGLRELQLHPTAPRPLDVDVHDIPARGSEPAHEHLDLRYLVVAPGAEEVAPDFAELHEIRWVPWDEVDALGPDHGLRRALAKARAYLSPVLRLSLGGGGAMPSQGDLEKRVRELEEEVRVLQGRRPGRVRYRSAIALGDIPLVSIAFGPDLEKGEMRGHARGVIAIGDIATGLVAIGGLATGGVAIGGLCLGLASLGGLALAVLLSVGGLAVGGTALGGAAIGRVAVGGGAVGEYACGGSAIGTHVVSATRRDPEAEAFFHEHGLEWLCPPAGRRRR
jgi:8-oxo-dGTP pyrophosphatase MutT (NUDIX family)